MVKDTDSDSESKDNHRLSLKYSNSAMIHLLTEQQVLMGKLLEELVRIGALNNESLNRITGTEGDETARTSVYLQLYQRFAGYLVICQRILDQLEQEKERDKK